MTLVIAAWAVFVAFVGGLWLGSTLEHRWWSARIKECRDKKPDERLQATFVEAYEAAVRGETIESLRRDKGDGRLLRMSDILEYDNEEVCPGCGKTYEYDAGGSVICCDSHFLVRDQSESEQPASATPSGVVVKGGVTSGAAFAITPSKGSDRLWTARKRASRGDRS